MLAYEHMELGPREDNRTGGKNKDFIVSTNIFFENRKHKFSAHQLGFFHCVKK